MKCIKLRMNADLKPPLRIRGKGEGLELLRIGGSRGLCRILKSGQRSVVKSDR